MDKNQIIGILLIVGIFVGFSLYNQPSAEEIAAAKQKRHRDSIAMAEQLLAEQQKQAADSVTNVEINLNEDTMSDSAKNALGQLKYGDFYPSTSGTENDIVLENNKIKVTISTKGAAIKSVEIKDYKTHDGQPLYVWRDDVENTFGLDFFAQNKALNSSDLYFECDNSQTNKAIFKAKTANENQWLEFAYDLKDDSYLMDFTISFHNLNDIINRNSSYIDLTWDQYLPILERGNDWENQNAGLYYRLDNGDLENLNTTSNDEDDISKTTWIAYKGQFFSSVIISKTNIPNANVSSQNIQKNKKALKYLKSKIAIPNNGETDSLSFYFGPNKYQILKNIQVAEGEKIGLQELIPLGWGIFGWINRIAIIPMFNWLSSFISNYGIIILIMTIIIKLVIFPLTYKSYQSSAKMRVLKPQVEQLSKKYPREDQALQKQQAVMDFYKRAGVNPMGGCLPALLQMPILIAMFRFFPASIELRQQSFLWANDLSSYDSILDLPFNIPFYGDHVSLFTLLMAVGIVVSTKINSGQMDTGQQMPGMKLMMYMMPVMMVFWFNNYSSGLSYYYFLSNIITIIQTIVARKFIDEDLLLAKLNAKASKNKTKKKSGFMARLEEMQRQQLEAMKQQQKKNGKR